MTEEVNGDRPLVICGFMLRDAQLAGNASRLLVYADIYSFTKDGRDFQMKANEISALLHMSTKTVMRAIAWLSENGYLEKAKTDHGTTYKAVVKEDMPMDKLSTGVPERMDKLSTDKIGKLSSGRDKLSTGQPMKKDKLSTAKNEKSPENRAFAKSGTLAVDKMSTHLMDKLSTDCLYAYKKEPEILSSLASYSGYVYVYGYGYVKSVSVKEKEEKGTYTEKKENGNDQKLTEPESGNETKTDTETNTKTETESQALPAVPTSLSKSLTDQQKRNENANGNGNRKENGKDTCPCEPSETKAVNPATQEKTPETQLQILARMTEGMAKPDWKELHFKKFYLLYPAGRRIDRDKARKLWDAIPSIETEYYSVISYMSQMLVRDWTEQCGRFVPTMEKFLTERKWTQWDGYGAVDAKRAGEEEERLLMLQELSSSQKQDLFRELGRSHGLLYKP